MINDIVQSVLQRLNPQLATLYAQYGLVRVGVGFVIGLPITFLVVVLSGSWIFAYIIGLMIGVVTISKGKEHSVQVAGRDSATSLMQNPAPSAPPNDSDTVKIVDCSTCGGKGYIDSVDPKIDPQTCTRCLGHGKLRLIRKSSQIPVIGAPKSKDGGGLMGIVRIPKNTLYMIEFIGAGVVVLLVGSAIGQSLMELVGLGIIGIGFVVFKPKKKVAAASNV